MVLASDSSGSVPGSRLAGTGWRWDRLETSTSNLHANGKPTVLFFWPMDFTFVCPSELIAFDKRYEEFQKRGVEVVGVSFDSEFVTAWRNTCRQRRHRCSEIRNGC